MANTQVFVELVALTQKFEQDMKRVSSDLKTGIAGIQKTFAALGIGLSVAGIGAWAQEIISATAALDDLADSTGSSVENLSRLANQAKISGVDFATLQQLMNKLAAGMNGVDEEGSKVGKALAALGVTAKDPAQALNEVAVKLNEFADGTAKAALARDLFGKGGPAFLAMLKDLAQAQDVAATRTAEQAEQAEKLEQNLRRLQVESTALANILLNDLVPQINAFINGVRIARAEGLGWFDSLNIGTTYIDRIVPSLDRLQQKLVDLRKAEASQGPMAKFFQETFGTSVQDKIANTTKEIAVLQKLLFQTQPFVGPPKPQKELTYSSGGEGRARTKEVDEFARALQRVREMAVDAGDAFAEAFSGDKLTGAQKALEKLQATDVWDKLTATQRESLTNAYKQVSALEKETEAWKKKREEQEKQIKVYQDIEAAQARAKAAFTDTVGHYAEENDALKRQIETIGQDDAARQKLAATLEYEKLLKQGLAADDEAGIAILQEQYAARLKLIDVYNQSTEALRKTAEYNRIFTDSFSDALVSVVEGTKSVSQAFKDMSRTIVHEINQIAAKSLAKSLFGVSDQGGGGLGALIGSFLSSTDSGIGFPTAGFAAGGSPPVGRPSLVGERGPELFIPNQSGVIVPNDVLNSRRAARTVNIVTNINVPGNTSRATADQIGVQVGIATSRALRRNS